ncbi:hypothetical protein GGI02_005405, partial [Coemansia sp. RSA 2322]
MGKDEIKKYLKSAVDMAITNDDYRHSQVAELQKNIINYAMKKLAPCQQPPHKVIVTCMVVQNTESGIHTANTMHWQTDQDIAVSYVFHNDAIVVD